MKFDHLLKFQKVYLTLLILLLLVTPLLARFSAGDLVVNGEESYSSLSTYHVAYSPWLAFIPVFLALLSYVLLSLLTQRLNISGRFTFFLSVFFILSPAFIHTFSTISTYAFLFPLFLLGFLMLTSSNKIVRYLAIFPLILVTLLEIFGAILLFVLLTTYFYIIRREKVFIFEYSKDATDLIRKNLTRENLAFLFSVPGLILVSTLVSAILLRTPFVVGPFHQQKIIPDLISAIGSASGISVFVLILALMGLTVTWKRKNFYFAYIFLPLVIAGYIYNTQVIFYLSFLTSFFATIQFTNMLDRKWTLMNLKTVTIFLVLLGVLFSNLAFQTRTSENHDQKQESLEWMNRELLTDAVVFSAPENSYHIKYFAHREPFYYLNSNDQLKGASNQAILDASYIRDLFPILEDNDISVIYITPEMREELSPNRGLLFLLQNERFKLLHTSHGSEVWMYESE